MGSSVWEIASDAEARPTYIVLRQRWTTCGPGQHLSFDEFPHPCLKVISFPTSKFLMWRRWRSEASEPLLLFLTQFLRSENLRGWRECGPRVFQDMSSSLLQSWKKKHYRYETCSSLIFSHWIDGDHWCHIVLIIFLIPGFRSCFRKKAYIVGKCFYSDSIC